ncbi:MAG: MmgE/PrpD family protein [Betaproteobacteria bacterium]|nr:MmgE/PrpD family protein [Betaproteobacteria bacterium]
MDETSRLIGSYAEALHYSCIPASALWAAKRSVIDAFGCAFGAWDAEPVQMVSRLAPRVAKTEPCATLFGTSIRTTPEMAAFVNGCMVRYLDFNDDYIHNDGPHPSDNIPGLFAIAEATRTGGHLLLCAIVLAYEVIGQLVDNAHFSSRGWDYVTESSIGTAVGAAKILGLPAARIVDALALAIAPNIALWQTRTGELSMWKGCAGPNAARNGLFAARLAAAGITGPNEIIEGQRGLWSQVTGSFNLGILGSPQHRFKIEDTFFKARPVMYSAQLPVETALALRGRIDLDAIASIRVVVPGASMLTSNHPEKWNPQTRETADHSIPYLVAAALVHGELSDKTFSPDHFRDPVVSGLLNRLQLEASPAFTKEYPSTFNCLIEVTGTAGQVWHLHRKNPKGHPCNPFSDADLEEKFLKLADGKFRRRKARDFLTLLWHLDELDDVGVVLRAARIGRVSAR